MSTIKLKTGINLYGLLTIFFICIKLALHFFTNTNYELHRDEMLYFNMGAHLSFGYATVPPFTGFVAFIAKTIFGYSIFGLRFFPAVTGALSIWLIAKIIRELGGKSLALVIASTAFILSGGFLLFNAIFTPNVFEQFFWLLLMYLFLKMAKQKDPSMFLLIGVIAGLAFLNKYSIVFLMAALFIALVISAHRNLLKSRYLWIAIVLAFLITIPNIIWQYQHGWPVVHHMDELRKTQMVNMLYGSFLEDLFSLGFVFTFVWLFGLIALLVFKKERQFRFLGIASLFIIVFFLFSHGKAYYTLGVLPFLLAFGGYAMEKYLAGSRAWINYAFLFVGIIFSLMALPFGLPLLKYKKLEAYYNAVGNFVVYPFSRWEDGKKHNISQVYSDMTGWNDLAGHVANGYYQLTEEEQKRTTIYGVRNYGYAGAVNFYGKKHHLPDAITFLETYTIWAPDTIPAGPLIYINMGKDDVTNLFEEVTEVGEVKDIYFREKGLKVYLCRKPRVDVQEVYKKKAAQEKTVYQ